MPKKFTEKIASYFFFSISATQGAAADGLGELITDVFGKGIVLNALSTCVIGRRMPISFWSLSSSAQSESGRKPRFSIPA